jgi:AhpD family alkylhydroperoxidase
MTQTTQPVAANPESRFFPTHDVETAPEESRPFLSSSQQKFGFLPLALARHATAPAMLESFDGLHAVFEKTSLTALEREAVALVLAGKFECKLCRDLHRRLAQGHGMDPSEIEALIANRNVGDAKLASLAVFVDRVVETRGDVSDTEVSAFVDAGFTPRHALEVVVGIATYTLSIFANRMTRSERMR